MWKDAEKQVHDAREAYEHLNKDAILERIELTRITCATIGFRNWAGTYLGKGLRERDANDMTLCVNKMLDEERVKHLLAQHCS